MHLQRRTAIVLAAAVGFLLVVPQASAAAGAPTVVINEVHYHPADDSFEGEFVELYNYGEEPVDLDGWLLSGGVEHFFAASTVIPPGAYLVLAADVDALTSRYGLDPAIVAGSYERVLSNEGETLRLQMPSGYVVSLVTYGDGDPWPESPDGLGPSLERVSPWREEVDPQAWEASIVAGGTPGAANSVRVDDGEPSSGQREALVAPGSVWRFFRGLEDPPGGWNGPAFDDGSWESGPAGFGYGDGDDATVLDDMQQNYLEVYIRVAFEVEDPSRFESMILSVDYDDGFVAYLNGTEIARRNVPVENSHEAGSPEEFAVSNWAELVETGRNVLALEGHNVDLGSSDFSLSPALHAVVRPDGEPPPLEPMVRPPRDLVINEVATGGSGTGWVELFNAAAEPVDASGRRILGFPGGESGYTIAAGTTLAPGARLVVEESDLGFEIDGIHACVLTTDDGRLIDSINPRTTPEGMSTGRLPDGAANRLVFTAPTRGLPNGPDIEHPVVINEIMYHPGDANTGGEFIELLNRSQEAVDLSGWAFTRGITYTIADGTVLEPGVFLVLASDPEALEARYGITGVLGPWEGRLRNDAETILVRDALRNTADRVRYADEGSWPEEPDGLGPSLELVHPDLENRYGPAWRASEGEGTPGAANSQRRSDPEPVVAGIEHSPVIPDSGRSVRVLATASDEKGVSNVTLFYEVDGGGTSSQIAMLDDGAGDDGVAGNSVYGADIPPQANGSVVAFWIRADAPGGQTVTAPAGAPQRACLYQVEDAPPQSVRPLYRLVLRGQSLRELRNRGVNSDDLLDATFVAGGRAYYNRGLRYRGSSARHCNPMSYRVQFDHDRSLHGIKRLNLNGCSSFRQWIGLDFLRRTGVPTPQAWFRQLSFNGQLESNWHLRVEAIDQSFLERTLPGDDGGNLYRGISHAELDYRGEDFSSYRGNYVKATNEELGDYSDVIDLSVRFDRDTTSDEDFPRVVEEAVDVQQWADYFAAFAVLGSTENSILLDNGDDYFLYHRPSDDRWILLPWDLDSCFDEQDQALFRPTVDSIRRFLRHRLFAPLYWCRLETLMDVAFDEELVNSRIDHLAPLFPASILDTLRSYTTRRRAYISARLSRELTVTNSAGGSICGGVLYPSRPLVTLGGMAPGCLTSSVVVNGFPAQFDVTRGFWSGDVDVSDLASVDVEIRDREDRLIERQTFPVEEVVAGTGQTPDVHVQVEGVDSIGFKAVEAARITDPDEDGSIWHEVLGIADALGTSGSILKSPPTGSPRAQGQSEAVYRIRFTSPGSYRGYYRARGFDRTSDSLWLPSAFNQAPDLNVRTSTGGFAWIQEGSLTVSQANVDNGDILELLVGIREPGTEFDAVVLSRDAGLSVSELADLVTEAGTPPRSIAKALPSNDLMLAGGSARLTLDGSRSHDGQCGADGLIYLWEKLEGPDGDAFSGDVTAAVVDVVFSAEGTYRYRLTVTLAGPGTESSTEVEVNVSAPSGNTFMRCDSNGDTEHNISDALFTLRVLFVGGDDGPCREASDCNGDGDINVTDAIFGLNFLFLGGAAPPLPYPGCDAAPVETCAASTCSN